MSLEIVSAPPGRERGSLVRVLASLGVRLSRGLLHSDSLTFPHSLMPLSLSSHGLDLRLRSRIISSDFCIILGSRHLARHPATHSDRLPLAKRVDSFPIPPTKLICAPHRPPVSHSNERNAIPGRPAIRLCLIGQT